MRENRIRTLILPIKGLLGSRFHATMMPRKHSLIVKVFRYKENLSVIVSIGRRADDVTERKELVGASNELKLFTDFLSCDKHLLSGQIIRLSLRCSHNNFVTLSEGTAKHYKVRKIEDNLYVRKMTVTDFTLSSIEKILLKNATIYNYIEVVSKTAGEKNWRQKNSFAKEPLRRMRQSMSIKELYFYLEPFLLPEIWVD